MKIHKIFIIMIILMIILFPTKIFAADNTDTIDSVMKGADSFVEKGKTNQIDTTQLKATSNFIYSILLGISMIIAIVVGILLGIKFMTGDSEGRADIKQLLVPYVVGVTVMFGAFIIWKLFINILS